MKDILNMTVGQTEIHPVIKGTINDSIPVPTYFKEYKEIQNSMLEKAQKIIKTKMPVYLKLGIGRVGLETGLYNIIDENNTAQIPNYINDSVDDLAKITILRNDQSIDFSVKIADIYTVDVNYKTYENNIGYLDIDIFSKTVGEQTKKALTSLENSGMQKLIIDLRDNTGGYLESAEDIANMFLEKGELIYSLENKSASADYYDETDEYKDYPIVIILNEKSASASEILAAALKDSYGATLVGTKSYGKGKVQQTYTLNDGSMAKYTSAKWLRPNGECIDGIGLKPDYEVVQTVTQDENGNIIQEEDTQLLKAIEIINTL